MPRPHKYIDETALRVHFNVPQLRFFTIMPQISLLIFGRGTGKTEGCTSMWLLNNLLKMPRCSGGLVIPNYTNLEKIMKGIWAGWRKLGFEEGKHFVIGTQPPKSWAIGYNAPRKNFMNYVSFYNGAGFYILSAKSKHNGADLDFLAVEEARYLKAEDFAELAPIVRANKQVFGHLSCHHSFLFVTDRPKKPAEEWIYRMVQQVDHEAIELIWQVQAKIALLKIWVRQNPYNLSEVQTTLNQIKYWEKHLNELRKGVTYYGEASTLDNIHAVGMQAIKNFKATLSEYEYRVSILNERFKSLDKQFYSTFNPNKHGYYTLQDIDINRGFDVSLDYNNRICCMVVGQPHGDEYRIVDEAYVLSPQNLEHLAQTFHNKHKHHFNKAVNYYFDPTAKQGRSAVSNTPYYEVFANRLSALGWYVTLKPTPYTTHEQRYDHFNLLFGEHDSSRLRIRYNRERCPNLELSLTNAEVVNRVSRGKSIVGKDKSAELLAHVDQRHTTHLSEAMDNLLMHVTTLKPHANTFYI
jgi:hypothetical protein